ncbi:MAG: alpha/beta fold hydrolase [Sphingomicrobium sp.]
MKRTMLLWGAPAIWASMAQAAEPVRPQNRAQAVEIVADLRKIVTPNGIERTQKIRIGGIDQWVSIRSRDRRNPVLLMLHGGPGFVAMPTSWYFARGWEEYFTVVQWDQRGAGKTYVANDPAKVGQTMTVERMNADVDEMIEWLRREYRRDKIFVAGHSWGSLLGLSAALRHPERLHAYIGLAQGIDNHESERRGWRFALDRAKATGNKVAVRELESIAPYGVGAAPIPVAKIMVQRKWLMRFGGVVAGRVNNDAEANAVFLSPEYTDEDVRQVWTANEFSEGKLLAKALEIDHSNVKAIKVSIILFLGRHDYNVTSGVAAEWLAKLKAPSKKLVWFEHSGHELMTEEPGKTLHALIREVRPFAERAGDVAP